MYKEIEYNQAKVGDLLVYQFSSFPNTYDFGVIIEIIKGVNYIRYRVLGKLMYTDGEIIVINTIYKLSYYGENKRFAFYESE